jgi:hypothetical protein
MIEVIEKLDTPVLVVLLAGAGIALASLINVMGFFFRDWWNDRKSVNQNQTNALLANTMSIQKLEIQMERLNDLLSMLPKLRADVDMAHSKIRDLDGRARS